jgi:hypothetical protein
MTEANAGNATRCRSNGADEAMARKAVTLGNGGGN